MSSIRKGTTIRTPMSVTVSTKAVLRIPDGELLDGSLPNRQMKLVQAWIEIHQDHLLADWQLASTGQTPFKINPLR
jgi:hypothetical protein